MSASAILPPGQDTLSWGWGWGWDSHIIASDSADSCLAMDDGFGAPISAADAATDTSSMDCRNARNTPSAGAKRERPHLLAVSTEGPPFAAAEDRPPEAAKRRRMGHGAEPKWSPLSFREGAAAAPTANSAPSATHLLAADWSLTAAILSDDEHDGNRQADGMTKAARSLKTATSAPEALLAHSSSSSSSSSTSSNASLELPPPPPPVGPWDSARPASAATSLKSTSSSMSSASGSSSWSERAAPSNRNQNKPSGATRRISLSQPSAKDGLAYMIFARHLRTDPATGEVDASAIFSPVCFDEWLASRRMRLKNPYESYRRALLAHVTGLDGRKPFDAQVEKAILRHVRVNATWDCFKGRNFDNGKPVQVGLYGFRGNGYWESRRSAPNK